MISITAEFLMTLGGISAFILTIDWVRRRQLREKYAVTWIGVAFVLLIIGLFPELVKIFADGSHLSYPSAVLFIALAAIYLFAFSVSVSLSRQYRRNSRLMQEVAILEKRLRDVEEKLAHNGVPASGTNLEQEKVAILNGHARKSEIGGQGPGASTEYQVPST
jgi:hypothetical protein